MILIDAKAQTYTSASTNVGDAQSCFIHVYSASTSSATVVIEQSLDGVGWATVATITNPTSTGELWKGPSLSLTRARISSWSSGTITVSCDFAQADVSSWTAIVGPTAPSSGYINVLKKSFTNAEVVAAGSGGTTGNVLVGTLPANSQLLSAYLTVDTQATFAAGTLTGSVGVTGTDYADWIVAGSLKAAAATIYGNAAAERGTDAAIQLYKTSKTIYMQVLAGAGDIANVTTCTGTILVLYVTYP